MTIINTHKTDADGRPVWRIETYTGQKVNGRRQRYYENFHGSKKDAKARLREIEDGLAVGVDLVAGKVGFEQYANEWLQMKSKTVAPRTLGSYRQAVGRLSAILGDMPLERINAPVVRKCMEQLSVNKDGKQLSGSTQRGYYRVFHIIMEQAMKDDLVRVNACDKVDAPKGKMRERRSLDAHQLRGLLDAVQDDTRKAQQAYWDKEERLRVTGHQDKPRNSVRGIRDVAYLAAVMLGAKTGMRPSEIFALQWKHVDFAARCIHVEQATATADGGLKSTKSDAGMRDVFLDAETCEYLANWRLFVGRVQNSLGFEVGASDWLVCSSTFGQGSHQNFLKWWKEWRIGAGLDGWDFYEVSRHTQATLLLGAGVPVKDVQRRMGHSSAAVTLGHYAHTDEDAQRALVNSFEKIF